MTVSREAVGKIMLHEIPKGEETVTRCLQYADYALRATYPTLSPLGEPIISQNSVQFMSVEEMIKRGRGTKKIDDIVLASALGLAGMPEETLEGYVYGVGEESDYTRELTEELPSLYVHERFLDRLSSDNPSQRADVFNYLGELAIMTVITTAPQKRDLPYWPWAKILKTHFDHVFIPGMEKNHRDVLDPDQLKKVQKVMHSLLGMEDPDGDEEEVFPDALLGERLLPNEIDGVKSAVEPFSFSPLVHFVAKGARVYVLSGDQSFPAYEFATGNDFHDGLAWYLSDKAIKKFREVLRANRIPVNPPKYNSTRQKLISDAEGRIEGLGREEGTRLTDKDLFDAYMSSTLPEIYHTFPRLEKDVKRLKQRDLYTQDNPWIYPK